MYYDALRKRVHEAKIARMAATVKELDITTKIAPCYLDLHQQLTTGNVETVNLPGGRGSCKSSFVSLEIVDKMMHDPDANGVVFRRVAATMRDSVYSQIAWAIAELGVMDKWRGSISPMMFTYIPTGQQIIFRGLDDPLKIKSIKPRRGIFKFVWFEELAEIPGMNTVRSVLQSVARGGEGFIVFNSFNPPQSRNHWANLYINEPAPNAVTLHTNYTMVPSAWLGERFIAEAERLKATNELAYRHEYMGEATGTGGEVFPNIKTREITDAEIDMLDYFYTGIDFGFAADPAAVIRLAYKAKTEEIFMVDEIYQRGLSNAELGEAIKAKGWARDKKGLWHLMYADNAEPKSIADLDNAGLMVHGAPKRAGSVNYGIKWLQRRNIIIDPRRTPNANREFTGYEYRKTKDGEYLADVPDKDNHLIDATRYALCEYIRDRFSQA